MNVKEKEKKKLEEEKRKKEKEKKRLEEEKRKAEEEKNQKKLEQKKIMFFSKELFRFLIISVS